MRYPFVLFLFVSFILVSSCKSDDDRDQVTSGRIDYKITYLNTDLDSKTLELLPRKMKLIFNEKQAANHIEGFLGFYKLNAITDLHTRKCSTVLKILDKSYLFKGKRDELMCCFDTMDDMKLEETRETKEIAGFTCKKAIVHLPSSGNSFVIYYTDEIDLRHPNSNNPYKKVDGVLMEFELTMLYLRMRFSAEKYHTSGSESQIAKLPENVKHITREQMTQILNRMMMEEQ